MSRVTRMGNKNRHIRLNGSSDDLFCAYRLNNSFLTPRNARLTHKSIVLLCCYMFLRHFRHLQGDVERRSYLQHGTLSKHLTGTSYLKDLEQN